MKRVIWIGAVVVLFLTAACSDDENGVTAEPPPSISGERQRVEVILDYEYLTRSQMIEEADAIFVAVIEEISATGWNQDNGKYWEQELEGTTITAMPVHTILVMVKDVAKDEIGLGETAVLTISGKSPADDGSVLFSGTSELGGTADYSLAPGDEVLLFVSERMVGWWGEDEQMTYNAAQGAFEGAKRKVLNFANMPIASYLRLGADGLYYPEEKSPDNEAGPVSLEEIIQAVQ